MTTEQTKDQQRAKDQAQAQFESIREMVQALTKAEEIDDNREREEAEQSIYEDPLSVRIREGWHNPGEEADSAEYEILLCWGGPAVRIIGELNEYQEPDSAKLEFQDWFIGWTNYLLDSEDEEILLKYARCFYYGR